MRQRGRVGSEARRRGAAVALSTLVALLLCTAGRAAGAQYVIPTPEMVAATPTAEVVGLASDGADGVWFDDADDSGPEAGTVYMAHYEPGTPGLTRINVHELPEGENGQIFGVAPGQNGDEWFTRPFRGTVARISSEGAVTDFPLGGHASPDGVVVDSSGNVWVAVRGSDTSEHIDRLTPSGELSEWGSTGGDPLNLIIGPDDNLWVAGFTGEVSELSSTVQHQQSTNYPLTDPSGEYAVDVASLGGKVWATIGGNAPHIESISPSGTIHDYKLSGLKPGQITAGPDGAVWFTGSVSKSGRAFIGRLDPNGGLSKFILGAGVYPLELAASPTAVYFTQNENGGGDETGLLRIPLAPGADLPVVTKIKPTRGLAGGGTSVTIRGHNFTGTTAVHFGSAESPEINVSSDDSLTAVSPRGPTGTVDVTVTTPAGTSALAKHDRFLYEPFAEYVALGDSFASGLGSFSYVSGTTAGSHPCYRATAGYAEQLAGVTHDTLAFVACQGASIGDLVTGAAPQLAQLSPSTHLVTLSIGGIDVGFPQVIASCISGIKSPGGPGCAQRDEPLASQVLQWLETGHPAGRHALPGVDPTTGAVDYSYTGVALPSLEALYLEITNKAPNARVFVVGYPHLFGPPIWPGEECVVGSILGIGSYTVLGSDISWINNEADTLNRIIEAAVQDAAARSGHQIFYVDPRHPFEDHGLCDIGSTYINPLVINTKKWPPSKWEPIKESFHPNLDGQNALAPLLEAAGA